MVWVDGWRWWSVGEVVGLKRWWSVGKVVECWEGGGVGKVVGLKRWRRGLNDRGMVGLEWWGWDGSGMMGQINFMNDWMEDNCIIISKHINPCISYVSS